MSDINSKAKAKTRTEPPKDELSEEFEKVLSGKDDPCRCTDNQCHGVSDEEEETFTRKPCPCGCESRPHLPEEDDFSKFIASNFGSNPPPKSFLTDEQKKAIEDEFNNLFGPQAQERYRRAMKKTRNELSRLYDELFPNKKP